MSKLRIEYFNFVVAIFLINIVAVLVGSTQDFSTSSLNNSLEAEENLSQKIYQLIEHFKQDDPVGLPLVPLSDPTDVPDIRQSIAMSNLYMTKIKLSGISKFRIKYIKTEIKNMEAKCGIHFELLTLQGHYSLSSFMSKSNGPFTLKLESVSIDGNASIGVEQNGKLRTQDIIIDIKFNEMKMDFKNLGFFSSIFQSVANTASTTIFEGIKPYILKDAYAKIKENLDNALDNIVGPSQIPNSISPIDHAIAASRKLVREKGYDPFKVNDYSYPGILEVKVYGTWLYGISTFYRLGEMSFSIENNTATVGIEIGTQEINGHSNWQVSIAKGMITRAGSLHFSVQHVKVLCLVSQPLNLSKKLKINDLQLDLGNIQIRSNGLSTFDYFVEFVVNILPNLLRYQIIDALEKPLMEKIQQYVEKFDVETLVKEKLDEHQLTGSITMNIKSEL